MRSHLLIGILLLAGITDRALAESFIYKLPKVGTSVVYDYSATVNQSDTDLELQGTLKLSRLVDDGETGLSRLWLEFDVASASNHTRTEYFLKVRESDRKIEFESATMKDDNGVEKELRSTHFEFELLRRFFDAEADNEPVTSCFTIEGVPYCAITCVQGEGTTPFGAGKLINHVTREVGGKSVLTGSIQIKSNRK